MHGPDRIELDRVQPCPGRQLPRHHLPRREPAEHQRQPTQRSAEVAVEQERHPHRPDLRSAGEIARGDVPQLGSQRLDAQTAHARQDGRHDQSLREMSDETRILRTVGVPIVIAVILLFVLPKMCAKVVLVSKARKEAAARAAGGLHIEPSQKPVVYPAGLDPERVRYLVEIDPTFSAPYTAHVNKSLGIGAAFVEQQQIIPVLQKLGYAEAGSDGTLTLTRDGMLHLDGLVDDGSSWTFPIATREFDAVTSIDSDGANAHAAIAWK